MKAIRLLIGTVLVMVISSLPALAHKNHKDQRNGHRHRVYTPFWVPNYMVRAEYRHVYFPDYDFYFDRWNGTYIYLNGHRWVVSTYIPAFCSQVNLNRAYKVGLHINSPRPYRYRSNHRGYHHKYYRDHTYGQENRKGNRSGFRNQGGRYEDFRDDRSRRNNSGRSRRNIRK